MIRRPCFTTLNDLPTRKTACIELGQGSSSLLLGRPHNNLRAYGSWCTFPAHPRISIRIFEKGITLSIDGGRIV